MSSWRFRRRLRKQPRAASGGRRRAAGSRAGVADWPGLLQRDDVLILDTETTGLDRHAEVIEVAVINTRGEQVLHELALPLGDVPGPAARVHGLTKTRLKQLGARAWTDAHRSLAPTLRAATLVLVYNAPYDKRLLQQTCALHAVRLPAVAWRCAMRDYAAWRRATRGATSGYGLEQAFIRECGADFSQEHRALSDCQMVLALMQSVAAGRRGA